MNVEPRDSMPPLRIIVVDDSEDNADMLAALLEEYGHRVRIAHDGARSLELIEEELPDLVFLDLGLPDMSGFDVAAEMQRRFGKEFRIIALTGYSGTADRERAQRSGIDSFITKPLRARQLKEILGSRSRASSELVE